ncbi:MAG: glycosyltransferase family 2 protein [Sedimentisphaerales bacterium]|nr:glycosyltransferase family 2 protein [Sedimentisphaerales bacterium]
MKLSIVIVSWNVKSQLHRCLKSIRENPPAHSFEMIVVDNASSDGSADSARSVYPEVVLISNRENKGFAAANNQGIKIAKGEYLLLLNPDTIIHKDSLDNLIKVLDENPGVAACGPRLIDPKGETYPSVGYIPTFRSTLYSKTFFRRLGIFRSHYKNLTVNNFNYDIQADVNQLSGAALAVRHSVMDQIGLMDQSFFLYYEDVDLCLRIRKAGFIITYVPSAIITHIGGASSVQVSAEKRIMLYRSLFVYFRKHKGRLQTILFGLIFKPGVIIKDILNLFTSLIAYIFFVLTFDRNRQAKSLAKIKNSAFFIAKYSLGLILRS